VLSKQVMVQLELRYALMESKLHLNHIAQVERGHRELLAQLMRRDELFSLLITVTNDGVIYWPSVEHDEQHWSPKLRALLGDAENLASEKGGYQAFLDRIHNEDKDGFLQALHDHFENHHAFEMQLRVRLATGAWRQLRMKAATVRKNQGKAEASVFLLRGVRE
jgi:hypothetical protein